MLPKKYDGILWLMYTQSAVPVSNVRKYIQASILTKRDAKRHVKQRSFLSSFNKLFWEYHTRPKIAMLSKLVETERR